MIRKPESRSSVKMSYLDVHTSSVLQDEGVAISKTINDVQPPAWVKDPNGFA